MRDATQSPAVAARELEYICDALKAHQLSGRTYGRPIGPLDCTNRALPFFELGDDQAFMTERVLAHLEA